MPDVQINYWAVLVAAAINMAVGAFWYSRGVFGNYWAKWGGFKIEDMQKRGNVGIGVSVITSLITAYILSHFVFYAAPDKTFAQGMETGFWLWVGFVAAMLASAYVFEGRSWKLWKLNAGYWLVVLIINGGLLSVWR